jgi:hypothetical protein
MQGAGHSIRKPFDWHCRREKKRHRVRVLSTVPVPTMVDSALTSEAASDELRSPCVGLPIRRINLNWWGNCRQRRIQDPKSTSSLRGIGAQYRTISGGYFIETGAWG